MIYSILVTSLLLLNEGSEGSNCVVENLDSGIDSFVEDFRLVSLNFDESSLKVVYDWSKSSDLRKFDGYAYKFVEKGERGDGRFPVNVESCVTSGRIWSLDKDGKFSNCSLPSCGEETLPSCNESAICGLLNREYEFTTKTQLEFDVQFKSFLDMHIVPYRGWRVGRGRIASATNIAKCWNDVPFTSQKTSPDRPNDPCNKTVQENEAVTTVSGPVSNFEQYDVTKDYRTNRASVSFRWKRPQNASEGNKLTQYVVERDGKVPRSQEIKNGGNSYDTITFSNLTSGVRYRITVSPLFSRNNISVLGAFLSQDFTVPDFDACRNTVERRGSYCDNLANCTNQPPEANVSAICSCPDGYLGNGISAAWEGGEGCGDPVDSSIVAAVAVSLVIAVIITIIVIVYIERRRGKNRRKILVEEDDAMEM